MQRIETLFLDLDGTLLDGGFKKAARATSASVAAAHPRLDAGAVLHTNRAVWEEYWPAVEMQWYLGALDNPVLATEAWRRTFAALAIDDPDLLAVTADNYHRLESAGHRLYDDVAETLDSARAAGVRTAIVTNGPTIAQRTKLRALGIDDDFDAVFVSGEIGAAKPDAAIFEHALRVLDAPASTAWHVGDLLEMDVAGARAAGIGAVWLNRDGRIQTLEGAEPHLEIRSLLELRAGWAA